MELIEAVKMLTNNKFDSLQKEKWADLGCGSGTFTIALANLLQPKSIIYAVDTNESALHQIPGEYNSVVIEKIPGDFETQDLPFKNLDGILMANSLHYIKDKTSFIRRAAGWLKETGCFLLVEYDTDEANQWVPYPLNFSLLSELFKKAGLNSIKKLREKSSVFGRAKMYSALSEK